MKTFLYPTDTTFGLGCSITDKEAIQKIAEIKQRPLEKSFVILVPSEQELQKLVEVPPLAWDLIDVHDKPLTLVYDQIINLPDYILSDDGSVAIRICQHPVCQRIMKELHTPIVSTSANVSGNPAPLSFDDIDERILTGVDYIYPECKTFTPLYTHSTIMKIDHENRIKIIRE